MNTEIYIGLMSGTSVDGLDVCAATFDDGNYSILAAETYEYPEELRNQLLHAHELSAVDLAQLSVDFGKFCGKKVKEFVKKNSITASYIASHGQTVFHTPQTGLTLQIGSGAHIAAESGIPTICDFRTLDVAMGGQGAPLVPIGDELLFSKYDSCLNIGGFANVSTNVNGKRLAWDICPANIVLNDFAQQFGQPYDKNGEIGRKGQVNIELFNELNDLDFYSKQAPKSLGREWVEQNIQPLFKKYNLSPEDAMCTYYEHCGFQIGRSLKKYSLTLCTGGGAKNRFLIERIAQYTGAEIVIPAQKLVDFKEALIFAYLGHLRIHGKPNCLASVTGAKKDVCCGVVWQVD